MSALSLAALVAAGAVALLSIAIAGRERRRTRRLGERVAREIEPYLLRRAAEEGLVASPPIWTSRTSPEEKVSHAARLATELVERERAEPLETSSTALAQTALGDPDAEETAPLRRQTTRHDPR